MRRRCSQVFLCQWRRSSNGVVSGEKVEVVVVSGEEVEVVVSGEEVKDTLPSRARPR